MEWSGVSRAGEDVTVFSFLDYFSFFLSPPASVWTHQWNPSPTFPQPKLPAFVGPHDFVLCICLGGGLGWGASPGRWHSLRWSCSGSSFLHWSLVSV